MSVSGKAAAKKILRGKLSETEMIYMDAYELAVMSGFEGTIDEWLESIKGDKGDPGYTPQKNVDYFDGEGAYVVSVEESTELGGANVVTFSDGTKLTVMNGTIEFEDLTDEEKASLKGEDGYTPQKNVDYFDGYTPVKGTDYFDGYTPVKGTDYWTSSDRAEIVNDVLSALPTWNGGSY